MNTTASGPLYGSTRRVISAYSLPDYFSLEFAYLVDLIRFSSASRSVHSEVDTVLGTISREMISRIKHLLIDKTG